MWIATTASSANIYICFIPPPPLDLNLREEIWHFIRYCNRLSGFMTHILQKRCLDILCVKFRFVELGPELWRTFADAANRSYPLELKEGWIVRGNTTRWFYFRLAKDNKILQNPFSDTIFGSFSSYEGGRLALPLKGRNALRGCDPLMYGLSQNQHANMCLGRL